MAIKSKEKGILSVITGIEIICPRYNIPRTKVQHHSTLVPIDIKI